MSRIRAVVDLRHPDARCCYYCMGSDEGRAAYLRHGPNPSLRPRYHVLGERRAHLAAIRRIERELAQPGMVGR